MYDISISASKTYKEHYHPKTKPTGRLKGRRTRTSKQYSEDRLKRLTGLRNNDIVFIDEPYLDYKRRGWGMYRLEDWQSRDRRTWIDKVKKQIREEAIQTAKEEESQVQL